MKVNCVTDSRGKILFTCSDSYLDKWLLSHDYKTENRESIVDGSPYRTILAGYQGVGFVYTIQYHE